MKFVHVQQQQKFKNKTVKKNDVLQNYMTFVSLSSHLFFLSKWEKKHVNLFREHTQL